MTLRTNAASAAEPRRGVTRGNAQFQGDLDRLAAAEISADMTFKQEMDELG